MRLIIDLSRSHNGDDCDEAVIDNQLVDTDDIDVEDAGGKWFLPLLTCGLAIGIVVRPVSELVKSAPPVVWLQSQVGTLTSASNQQTSTVANRLYAAMQRKGYPISKGEGETNIIYLRGGDINGQPSGNRINEWSDARFVLMFRGGESSRVRGFPPLSGLANPEGQPYIAGAWKATIKPGLPAIRNPLGRRGAAFIEDGYYEAWRLGIHQGIFGRRERGLVQVAPVNFRRDVNRDGNVSGEPIQIGMIGLNQHSGSDSKEVDKTSYACLVGQSSEGHLNQFVPLLENDPRYKRNSQHMFGTAILSISDL
ncbi:hypothetical protein NIES4071_103320 (plasmid) [Calothrix sp. NIES-4071]|nr:hypothetical protein NIES4071_103320 [Calothrix sp. NIES-4071]BAZ64713.1 hypothetical protein NIES4105_104460 [Calothrix sp. NIES-4105]